MDSVSACRLMFCTIHSVEGAVHCLLISLLGTVGRSVFMRREEHQQRTCASSFRQNDVKSPPLHNSCTISFENIGTFLMKLWISLKHFGGWQGNYAREEQVPFGISEEHGYRVYIFFHVFGRYQRVEIMCPCMLPGHIREGRTYI